MLHVELCEQCFVLLLCYYLRCLHCGPYSWVDETSRTGNIAHAMNIMLSKCAGTERGQALQSIISVKGRDKGTDSEEFTPSYIVFWFKDRV